MTREGMHDPGEQLEAPKRSGSEILSETLGQRVYQTGERMRLNALEAAGISPAAFPENARAVITLTTGRVEACIETRSLRIGDPSLRGISLIEIDDEKNKIYQAGRYFEPDGTMWVECDSSQGAPWLEASLKITTLAAFASRLEDLANSDHRVRISVDAYHQASAPYAVSA